MKNLFNKAKLAALSVAPATLMPENQYSQSFAAVLCLAVSADQEFAANEFAAASVFIEQDTFLRDEDLTVRTVEFFKSYCGNIKTELSQGSIDFPAMQTELIAIVRKCPPEYLNLLRVMITNLRAGCSTTESSVLNRINL